MGAGPCAMRLAAEAVARLDDERHIVLLIGSQANLALARQCGLRPQACLPRLQSAAVADLRQVFWAQSASGGDRGLGIDVVHAWSPGAAVIAAGAMRARPAMGATLVVWAGAAPAARGPAWLARRMSRRNARAVDVLLAFDDSTAARWLDAGVTAEGVTMIEPPIDRGMIAFEDRALLRQRWDADETTFVVGLLGEPMSEADAWQAANAAGRAALTGKNVRLVLHHDTARRRGLAQWLAPLGLAGALIVDDDVALPWQIAPGLDAALWLRCDNRQEGAVGAAPSMLPLLWAMAAGVPVIAERGDATAAVLGDDRGWLVPRESVNGAAAVILDLYDDPRERARRCAIASAWVAERFASARFVDRLRSAYGIRVPFSAAEKGTRIPQPKGRRSRAAAP